VPTGCLRPVLARAFSSPTCGISHASSWTTSQAEHRLVLRHDNAGERLGARAYECGLLAREEFEHLEAEREQVEREVARLSRERATPAAAELAASSEKPTWADLIRRPGVGYEALREHGPGPWLGAEMGERVEVRIKYAGYIERQRRAIEKLSRHESALLPAALLEGDLHGISREAREKLRQVRPASLGQAMRLPGISPSDAAALMIHLARFRRQRGEPTEAAGARC